MPVLVTCKFHKDTIKKKGAIVHIFFWRSRASSSEVNKRIWMEFELIRDFMPVLVICKFDDDLIKQNEGIIVSTTFSPLYVYGNFFGAQGRVIPKRIVRSGRKSNLSSLPASLTKFLSKMKALSCPQHFPNYTLLGAFGRHGNQDFHPIFPKNLMQASPPPQ